MKLIHFSAYIPWCNIYHIHPFSENGKRPKLNIFINTTFLSSDPKICLAESTLLQSDIVHEISFDFKVEINHQVEF